jgi:hypothetical protein
MLRLIIAGRSRVLFHRPLLRLFSVLVMMSFLWLPAGVLAAPAGNCYMFNSSLK